MGIEDRLRWLFWPTSKSDFQRELAALGKSVPSEQIAPQAATATGESDTLAYVGPLDQAWTPLVRQITECLEQMTSFLTVSVSGMTRENCEPYVQASRFGEGSLLLDAVSDNNLDQPLSVVARNTLTYLGWKDPDGPEWNHYVILSPNRPSNAAIAEFLLRTLLDVYGADSECEFECSFE